MISTASVNPGSDADRTRRIPRGVGVIDGVYGIDGAIVAAHIALWRGHIDDAAAHAGRILAVADEVRDYEVFICAASSPPPAARSPKSADTHPPPSRRP